MYDICGGNRARETPLLRAVRKAITPTRGNFKQCEYPANPFDFLEGANINSVFRFILSHPDCDHIDGLDALLDSFTVHNFWHTGITRTKPDFTGSPFREGDWDRYEIVQNGEERGTKSLMKRAGARFKYANDSESGRGGDGLYILAPDDGLVEAAELTGDYNDASFVILYRSLGGRVLIPGDAHDKTWEYILEEYTADVEDVGLLIAPHHGRKSGRSYEFLDTLRPKLTLFGCGPSDALAYDAWRGRDLTVITNNQAGCVTVVCEDERMSVYVENRRFAEAMDADPTIQNEMGFYHIGTFEG